MPENGTERKAWWVVGALGCFFFGIFSMQVARYAGQTPWLLAAVPLLLPAGYLALQEPRWLLLIFVAFVPLDIFTLILGENAAQATLFKLLFPVLLGLLVLHRLQGRFPPLPMGAMDVALLVLALYTLLPCLLSPHPEVAFNEYRRYVSHWLIYYVASRVCVQELWRRRLYRTIILSGVAGLLISFYMMLFESASFYGERSEYEVVRITGASNINPNQYVTFLVLPLGLIVAKLMESPPARHLLVYVSGMIVFVFGIMMTYSRSAFVALCVSGVVLLAPLRRLIRPGMVVLVLVALAVAAALAPESYRLRLASLFNEQSSQDYSLMRRANYLIVGARIFEDYPLFGAGPNNFYMLHAQARYQPNPQLVGLHRQPHNEYLKALTEIGLVGTAIYGVFLLAAWVTLRRALRAGRRAEALGLLVALTFFCFMGLFLQLHLNKMYWLLFGLIRSLDIDRMETPTPKKPLP